MEFPARLRSPESTIPHMAHNFPRCLVTPLPNHQVSFSIDRIERTRWHYGREYPRPFFYPVVGASGESLTRMGHPGAPNHDHHRSLWFAHNDLMGHDFWSENTTCRIEQQEWFCYEDGDEEARMAVGLRWVDGHDPKPLLRHELYVSIIPGKESGEFCLELQSNLIADADGIEFRKNNFGILGIRVAKSISTYFGGGKLTGSDGREGEPATFGEPNRWVDYSGPVLPAGATEPFMEGLALIDHPTNPQHPARWHTRADGWFGPSLSRMDAVLLQKDQPLIVRYLLYVHRGSVNPSAVNEIANAFAAKPALRREKPKQSNVHWQLIR